MIRETACDADSTSAKAANWHEDRLRRRGQPHQRLGHDPEHPFGADHGRGQIVARVAKRAAAGPDDVPSGKTTSRPRMWLVVTPYLRQCGPPEFSATLPPIVQAFWLDGSGAKKNPSFWTYLAQLQVDHAGFDQGGSIFAIDLEDAIHPGQGDDDPALLRDRTAGEPGARAPRNDRKSRLGSQLDDRRDLWRSFGQDDRRRAPVSTAPSTEPSYS